MQVQTKGGLPYRAAKRRAAQSQADGSVTPTAKRARRPPKDGLISLTGHKQPVSRVVSVMDGARVATACLDGKIRVYCSTTGRPLLTLKHEEEIEALGALTDTLVVCGGGRSQEQRAKGKKRTGGTQKAWEGNKITVYDAVSGRHVAGTRVMGVVWAVAKIAGRGCRFVAAVDANLHFFEFDTATRELKPIGEVERAHEEFVQDTAVWETRLATASTDGTAHVWCTDTRSRLAALENKHTGYLHCVDMNQNHIVTGGADKCLVLYNADTYAAVRVINMGKICSCITFAALVGDGHIVSASAEHGLYLSRLSGESLSRSVLPIHVYDGIILHDGRLAACGGEKEGGGKAILFKAEKALQPVFEDHALARFRGLLQAKQNELGAFDDDEVCEMRVATPPPVEIVDLDAEDDDSRPAVAAPEMDPFATIGEAVELWGRYRVEVACRIRGIVIGRDIRILRSLLKGWNPERALVDVDVEMTRDWSTDRLMEECRSRGLYHIRKEVVREQLVDSLVSYVPPRRMRRQSSDKTANGGAIDVDSVIDVVESDLADCRAPIVGEPAIVFVPTSSESTFDLNALETKGLDSSVVEGMGRRDLSVALAAFYVHYDDDRMDEFCRLQETLQKTLRRIAADRARLVGTGALKPEVGAERIAKSIFCGGDLIFELSVRRMEETLRAAQKSPGTQ